MVFKSLSSLIIVGVLLGRTTGSAQPADNRAEAQRLFQLGQGAYEAGRYQDAIEALENAYRLAPLPGLLFNLAQAHRMLGPSHCTTALAYYERFLALAHDDPNVPLGLEHSQAMRTCVQEQQQQQQQQEATTTVQAPAPASPATPEPIVFELPPEPNPWTPWEGDLAVLKTSGLVILLGGLAVLTWGAVEASQASSAADDITNACAPECTWNADLAARFADQEAQHDRSVVLSIAGGAAAVSGILMYALGVGIDGADGTNVEISASATAVGVQVSGRL